MVDVNPRALACAEWGLKKNEVRRFETCLNAYVEVEASGSYDLVLANPPYYSDQQIAKIMFEGGFKALRPGDDVIGDEATRVVPRAIWR